MNDIMQKINNTTMHKKRGISLVISLIMMTLLLTLSLSISNIILRQIRLTAASTNSQTSFYAADSGLECALYWDTHSDGTVSYPGTINVYDDEGNYTIEQLAPEAFFGTSTVYNATNNPVKCGIGDRVPLGWQKVVSPDETIATTTFAINFGKSCAEVEVVKTPFRTKISSNGYNAGANSALTGCDTENALLTRVVERGLVFSH